MIDYCFLQPLLVQRILKIICLKTDGIAIFHPIMFNCWIRYLINHKDPWGKIWRRNLFFLHSGTFSLGNGKWIIHFNHPNFNIPAKTECIATVLDSYKEKKYKRLLKYSGYPSFSSGLVKKEKTSFVSWKKFWLVPLDIVATSYTSWKKGWSSKQIDRTSANGKNTFPLESQIFRLK